MPRVFLQVSTTIPIPLFGTLGEPLETDLVARARGGDAAAFGMLAECHLPDVYRLTRAMLQDADAAEDAAQETFVRALRAMKGFRGDASFRTWLLRIAVNTTRSMMRQRSRRREAPLELAEAVPAPPSPGAEVVGAAEWARVSAALAALPEKQRLAVTLRVYSAMSFRDIGRAADCSEASARVNYHYGIKRLRELLR